MRISLEDRLFYTATTCFERFALPRPPGTEPVADPRVIAIGVTAKALDETHHRWLDPEGAPEVELKKRTLTNLYNQRLTWRVDLHAALKHAVWAAYGWEDTDPASIPIDQILSRLLALNLVRAGTKASERR